MVYEIHPNKLGKPYLKKVDKQRKVSEQGRGLWVQIGRLSESGIERVISINTENGYRPLIDEDGFYRVLVLTD